MESHLGGCVWQALLDTPRDYHHSKSKIFHCLNTQTRLSEAVLFDLTMHVNLVVTLEAQRVSCHLETGAEI